uniref:Uncharacterized protein n=1 Tax=Arundo donax TaxID=35708 RepID=A0A0A9GL52_ARUDO
MATVLYCCTAAALLAAIVRLLRCLLLLPTEHVQYFNVGIRRLC